jgi:hypothetical protein
LSNRVPLAVRLVIERCLTKEPTARYQRAADVRDALDSIARRNAWPLVGRLLVSTRWRRLAGWSAAAALIVAAAFAAPRVRTWFGGATTPKISTLAFVPMETSASDSISVYYAQGITEALIVRLGAIAEGPCPCADVSRARGENRDVARRAGEESSGGRDCRGAAYST